MRIVTVTEQYAAAYTERLRLKSGDRVRVGKTDIEWPGWYWCTNDRDESAWVHESFLTHIEDGTAKSIRDYDSSELSVKVGDKIEIEYELGDWLWGMTESGEQGWVPVRNTNWHE